MAVTASLVVGGGFVASSKGVWAMETGALDAEVMATLIQMARDIYPHDRFGDHIYAAAVKGHDDKAAEDADYKGMIEAGVAALDTAAVNAGHASYVATGWEADRVSLLESVANDGFFQTIRGGLVVSLYNQQEVWGLLGYEGSSFEQGGYLSRGFDDINWL
ncbi:MAG: Twin-arginine translocation pathway signal [Gammaproteobacteria bacterium]|nr:Twin-arginine translocation pathway signal [Gammaproteobacteria bacterium]